MARRTHARRTGWAAAALGACAAAGGCTTPLREWYDNHLKVGPNYHRPKAAVAEHWIDAADPRVKSEPVDDSAWWRLFDDAVLDDLVKHAYAQNLTVREAGFRVLSSRARLAIAVGNLLPQTQTFDASYTRNAISGTVANRQFAPDRFFDLYAGGFNLAWELDLWGRFRRSIEAARGDFEATVEEYDAVLVTLVADVAQAYVQIRVADQQLAYLRANVELQKGTLTIVRDRFEDGVVSEVDVEQAKLNLARTEAQVPPVEQARREAANALCTLLGIPPEDLAAKIGPAGIPRAPEAVCVGIPAELLRRRPDVRAAERRVAAQSARIGVAESDLYPALSITGTIGVESSQLSDLFDSRSFFGTIGPSIRWNVLNYGRLLNAVRVQDARFQEFAAAYQQQVLVANQEVEDGLVRFLKSQEAARAEQRAVRAAARSADLSEIQYKEGTVDYNRVFVTQRQLVDEELAYANQVGNIAFGLIQVYRALGGGWQIRLTDPACGDGTAAAAPAGGPPKPLDAVPVASDPKKKDVDPAPAPRKDGGS